MDKYYIWRYKTGRGDIMGFSEDLFSRTHKELLEEMIGLSPDDIDTRTGSFTYDMAMVFAVKLAEFYAVNVNQILDSVFLSTATGKFLDERAANVGISRIISTKCRRSAKFVGYEPDVGSRFQGGDYFWQVIEPSIIECETLGSGPNKVSTGTHLIPINAIAELKSATMGDILVIGRDQETDDELRERATKATIQPSGDGNVQQLTDWCKSVAGVGKAVVLPCWNGINTAKGIITTVENKPANPELVNKVQEYMDPGKKGLGEGKAPIGCVFTVESAQTFNITVRAQVKKLSSVTEEQIKLNFKKELEEFLNSQVFKITSLSINRIGAMLLNIEGVEDYTTITLNGSSQSLTIPANQIPTITEVVVTYV